MSPQREPSGFTRERRNGCRETSLVSYALGFSAAPLGACVSKTGIAMGPPVWWEGWNGLRNRNASVTGNTITGDTFGYGFLVRGVSGFTVTGNIDNAYNCGRPTGGNSEPTGFLIDWTGTSGNFQPEFMAGRDIGVLA